MKEDRSDYKECWQEDSSYSYAWELKEEINHMVDILVDNDIIHMICGTYAGQDYSGKAYDYARTNNVPNLLEIKEQLIKKMEVHSLFYES